MLRIPRKSLKLRCCRAGGPDGRTGGGIRVGGGLTGGGTFCSTLLGRAGLGVTGVGIAPGIAFVALARA